MKDSGKFNRIFNVFILAGMTVVMALTTVVKLRSSDTGSAMLIVAAFGSLMGILSTVCSANAKILTFIFGFFDVTVYGVMCFLGERYGNAALHLLYFLPMQFVGFAQWRRRGASSDSRVRARRLDRRGWLLYGGIFLAGLAVSYFILAGVSSSDVEHGSFELAVMMDAVATMCNILGQLLMSMAYMEQWIFWIGVNISSVLMWTATMHHSPDSSYALIYVIKYAFYLLNSLNGLRLWIGLSRTSGTSDLQN